MNIEVIWPKKADVFRRDYCVECYGRVTPSTRGRPRQYCSAACRQRRYRNKINFHSRDYQFRKEDRAAERVLRKVERARGNRIDDVTPIIPGTWIDRRHHLIFGLRDGRRLEYCLWCGVPILREVHGPGARTRCCSRSCREQLSEFVRKLNLALLYYGDNVDPVVMRRLTIFNLNKTYVLPPIRSRVGLCAHCFKPFAATHLARKYCSKKCRQNAWYAAHKTCQFCKRRFRPERQNGWKQLYCSRSCWNRGVKRKPPLSIPRTCQECGSPFVANRRSYTTKVYCSRKCMTRVWARRRRAQKKAGLKTEAGVAE